MYRFLFALAAICTLGHAPAFAQDSTPSSESPLLPWTTDFDQALELAKAQSRPLYVYFSGHNWCIWCKRMDKEIHNQDSFRQKMVGKFIFVRVDLPAGSPPTDKVKELLSSYHVKGVPTVLVISPDGNELSRFRYRQISPEAYADVVIESIEKEPPSIEPSKT